MIITTTTFRCCTCELLENDRCGYFKNNRCIAHQSGIPDKTVRVPHGSIIEVLDTNQFGVKIWIPGEQCIAMVNLNVVNNEQKLCAK